MSSQPALPPTGEAPKTYKRRPTLSTFFAVLWLLAAGLFYLLPSLVHGPSLGSMDILDVWGLTAQPGASVHNGMSGDQIQDMIPWAVMSWRQVHAGRFPLWNPYSGFGLPLFGNFQSASLSLPALVSYLLPLRLVFTVQIYVKMLIAGTGVLWMARRLGLGHLAATFGATAFMLSGSFTGWLGWPMSGTAAWLGWAVGAALLIVRGGHRRRHVAGLAVVVAFVIYAGHPETILMVLGSTAVIAAAALVGPLVRRTRDALIALGSLLAAAAAGLLLSAPLLLPGLQIIGRANRAGVVGYAKPYRVAVNLFFATYHGMPPTGYGVFGSGNYYEGACYVGVVAAALAGVALVFHWRRGAVIGMALVGVAAFFLAFSQHLARVLDRYPFVKEVQWTRMLLVLDFVLAALAALGLQVLVDRWREPVVRRVFAGWAVAGIGLISAMWANRSPNLSPHDASIQARSFVWPLIGVVVMVVVAAALEIASWVGARRQPIRRRAPAHRHRPRVSASPVSAPLVGPAAGWLMFAASALFLLTATPRLLSSSDRFFAVTPAVAALESEVGQARVGFESCSSVLSMPAQGILPEANDVYQVSEAAAYDGVVPKSYFTSYFAYLHEAVPAYTGYGQWCPAMANAQIARHYGVGYILTATGQPQPAGTRLAAVVGGERLFRVPGGGLVAVAPVGAPADGPGAQIPAVDQSDPSVIRTTVHSSRPSTAYIHVTDFPGWHATLDGHPLGLRPWGGTMLAASLPAGTHRLVFTYRPGRFVVGEWLAFLSAVLLVGTLVWPTGAQRGGTAV